MPHPRSPSFSATVISHALAGVVGGAIALVIASGQSAPATCEGDPAARPTTPVPTAAASMPPPALRCAEPPTHPEPNVVEPDVHAAARAAEASSEATLAELGAMPMAWAEVRDAPAGLRPDRFEASMARAAAELELAMPEVDCSELPCVVIARDPRRVDPRRACRAGRGGCEAVRRRSRRGADVLGGHGDAGAALAQLVPRTRGHAGRQRHDRRTVDARRSHRSSPRTRALSYNDSKMSNRLAIYRIKSHIRRITAAS